MLSYANSSNTPHIKEILPATYGITFLGTPHRGTSLVHHAKIAYDITKVLGKNPATKTLSDLEINSQTLDRVSTYFKQLLMKHPIQIQTFREELPINGVMVHTILHTMLGVAVFSVIADLMVDCASLFVCI